MKQLKCLKCSKIWYVDDTELNSVNTCPFCSSQIRCKGTIGNIDTLGKAIYQAISTGGLDLLTSSERISGYLLDLLPDQKKEIRIFTKTFDDDYLSMYRNAFDQPENDIEVTMNKLRSVFIEEEGLSDTWANMLCKNCQTAISYYQGQGFPNILSCQIQDVTKELNNKTQKFNNRPVSKSKEDNSTEELVRKVNKPSCRYKVGDEIEFGHDENKPMQWLILRINNGVALIHYSGKTIKQKFHEKSMYIKYDVPWKDCSLREWLNHDFISKHFTKKEVDLIRQVDVKTADVVTTDRVFCLSIEETNKYKRDFDNFDEEPWLLRDKGIGNGNIATYAHGEEHLQSKNASCCTSIRPAMYISTSYFTK